MVKSETITAVISFFLVLLTCYVLLQMFKDDKAMSIIVAIVSIFSVFLIVFWLIGRKSGIRDF